MKRLVDVEFEVNILGTGDDCFWEAEALEENYEIENLMSDSYFDTPIEAIKHARDFAELNGLKFKIEGE